MGLFLLLMSGVLGASFFIDSNDDNDVSSDNETVEVIDDPIETISLDATDGDDVLSGDQTSNTILAGDGDDTLSGALVTSDVDFSRYDVVDYSDGETDVLEGGAGDDTLYGADDDYLYGGEGDDTFIAEGGQTLTGGEGEDTFIIREDEHLLFETNGAEGPTVITDFDPEEDTLIVTLTGPSELELTQAGLADVDLEVGEVSSVETEAFTLTYVGVEPTDHGEGIVSSDYRYAISVNDSAVEISEIDGDTHVSVGGEELAVLSGVSGITADQIQYSVSSYHYASNGALSGFSTSHDIGLISELDISQITA